MRSRTTLGLWSGLIISAAVFAGWFLYDSQRTVDVSLRFEALVDGEAFVRNRFLYPNPGGKGSFRVRDFQFFVSNVKLIGEDNSYAEAASYHLARFDNDSKAFTILLREIPARAYERIEFAIGIDAAANESIVSTGDLDPNGRMAWNWESGYKFVLFEGRLQMDDVQIPLVYHVGFDENYTKLSFPLEEFGDASIAFSFNVDLMRLFSGASTIDMASMPNVKFDREDSGLIAGNFASMVSLQRPDNAAEPASGIGL